MFVVMFMVMMMNCVCVCVYDVCGDRDDTLTAAE